MQHIQRTFNFDAPEQRPCEHVVEATSRPPPIEPFREWFDEVGGRSEPLPDDAFIGREAFRQTGVRTRLIIIDKEDV